jgi:DNA-binding NarL/FixJ family response regulator
MSGNPPGVRCVLFADRHHGVSEGACLLLRTMFEVVVMVADEASLIESASRLRPALAVVDLSLSRRGNLGWLARLRAGCPGLKVIVISVHDEAEVARAARAAGADGFVLKREIVTELIPAAESVLAGHTFP